MHKYTHETVKTILRTCAASPRHFTGRPPPREKLRSVNRPALFSYGLFALCLDIQVPSTLSCDFNTGIKARNPRHTHDLCPSQLTRVRPGPAEHPDKKSIISSSRDEIFRCAPPPESRLVPWGGARVSTLPEHLHSDYEHLT